jgi:2-phosphosulfolactate phosphatase
MELYRVNHDTAAEGRGVVIVIDVIRAFSVAAYAFAGGARELWLVREVEQALALREREPAALLAGEVGGRQIPGFDFSNSPAQMAEGDVRNRLLIQRTGAGTRGAVSAINADHLLVCALVNARATATYAAQLANAADGIITFYPTATLPGEADEPNEDEYCADYLAALLLGAPDADAVLAANIERLRQRERFGMFAQGYPDCPAEDVPAVLAANRFSFAMEGTRQHWHDIEYVSLRRVDVPKKPLTR